MSVFYVGVRGADKRCLVWKVTEYSLEQLPPCNDLVNHSPDGFEWGYGGSGPSQLALAMLADALGNEELAVYMHQQFKWDVVARIKGHSWVSSKENLVDWFVCESTRRFKALGAIIDVPAREGERDV